MNNYIYFTQAIYNLYPQVKSTQGDVAYDAEGNVVDYDQAAVDIEAAKLACKSAACLAVTAALRSACVA